MRPDMPSSCNMNHSYCTASRLDDLIMTGARLRAELISAHHYFEYNQKEKQNLRLNKNVRTN
jgi:hypothetical protein